MKKLALKAALILVIPCLAFAKETTKEKKGKPKVIKLDVQEIKGRVHKPQAFYIIQRSNLNFEGLELKENLLPKISNATEKAPF